MPHCWHYMLATTVLVSKNCCQVPVFIGGRDTVIMETEGKLTCTGWQGRRKVDANYKEKSSTKHKSPEEVSHLPTRFPRAPSPPAEQGRCPGNGQGPTRTHQRKLRSQVGLNQLSTPRAEDSWQLLGSPNKSHAAVCVVSFEPQSPAQVLGTAPADISLDVILTRKWTEGCRQPTISSWLATCFLSCSSQNPRKSPLSIVIMVLISPVPSMAGTRLSRIFFPPNIFSIYRLKWLHAAFT